MKSSYRRSQLPPRDFSIQAESDRNAKLWDLSEEFFQFLRQMLLAKETTTLLSTDQLLKLGTFAENLGKTHYKRYSRMPQFLGSPLEKTRQERNLAAFLETLFGGYSGYEVCPRIDSDRMAWLQEFPLIGPYSVDLIVWGLRPRCSGGNKVYRATVIEVDGEIHDTEKGTKDARQDERLLSMGFWTLRIPNNMVDPHIWNWGAVSPKVERIFRELKESYRRPTRKDATERLKRLVALRNIATWMTPEMCDKFLESQNLPRLNIEGRFKASVGETTPSQTRVQDKPAIVTAADYARSIGRKQKKSPAPFRGVVLRKDRYGRLLARRPFPTQEKKS